jgi:hypothetical protein
MKEVRPSCDSGSVTTDFSVIAPPPAKPATGAGQASAAASADPTAVACALGVLDTLAALAARYRAERTAWRARLAAVAPVTVRRRPPPRPDSAGQAVEPDWPVTLAQPPPEEPETVLELLYRTLGTVPIPG